MLPRPIRGKVDYYKKYFEKLGIKENLIKDEDLFMTSFIHKSYTADLPYNLQNNERLEFLGDAVLGCVISKLLYQKFDDIPESQLTLYKIALVREENLADAARDINLGDYIFLGHGEEKSGGKDKDSILSDTLEAVLGYIYIDIGIDEVEKIIEKFVYSKIEKMKNISVKSFKSSLQELVQKLYKETPVYEDVDYEKDAKGNVIKFKSNVYINSQFIAEGYGINKKKSQEEAAKKAFEYLEANS
ncbi:ribonuclease III [Candidatus Absconditicoccus praedator]|uniref:ribonuclease III n=1 Tax=Candidatus Absconditicoccus praedator TaxID=2735562 RepID=UPI001E44F4D4|nr:ribonuclease III [Candidatus Absconditicoccus praedator]UFX82803.1 ribonuclease III [Candidatus Absconditicoccus praedator]